MYSFSYLEPVCCSMSRSNCCFLTCIQISQEAGQVVWYSHLLKNFPQFIVIHTVKGFGIVKKAEIDVFLENLDLSTNIKDFKGGKKARLKEERGGGGREGAKGVALQTSPATYRCPGVLGLFPEPPEKGGLELALSAIRPYQNQNSSSLPRGGDQSPILSLG